MCWSHVRRKVFKHADVEGNIREGNSPKSISPIAFEAVQWIDKLFGLERQISGLDAAARLEARQRQSAPLVGELETWLRSEQAWISKPAKVVKAIDFPLSTAHRPGFTRRLKNDRVWLSNTCAKRSQRGVALGRKSWLFTGSERGSHRAAALQTLIGTVKLNGIYPQA